MPKKNTDERTQAEIARRRDETIKRMIAMKPKTQKGEPKRKGKKQR